jgi:hypothetical protein
MNENKTTNSLIFNLLYAIENASFDRNVFPSLLQDILDNDGDVNTQLSYVLANLIDNNAVIAFALSNNDFYFWLLRVI